MFEQIATKMVRARKTHLCNLCLEQIAVGDKYELQTNKQDGEIYNWKCCSKCLPILRELFKNGHYPDGIEHGDYLEHIAEVE